MAMMTNKLIQAGEPAGDAALTTSVSNITPTANTIDGYIEGIDTALLTAGGGGPAPDYTPPAMAYKDADEITVPVGRYYKAGWRLNGQYQDTTNMSSYWDVAAAVDVDVDAPGTMIGGDVVSSWYSVWMTSASTFLVLPYIRVDAIAYGAPSTTINPAAHADGTTANNNFVSANDVFNDYRLMQLCDTSYHGTIHTIADCADATPDTILITGDVTSQIAATEWLQMIPPSGTACLYLGSIFLKSDGNLRFFSRKKGFETIIERTNINGYNHATDFGKSDLSPAIPPTASTLYATLLINSEGTSAKGVEFSCSSDAAGAVGSAYFMMASDAANVANYRSGGALPLFLSHIAAVYNRARITTGSWVAATSSLIVTYGYDE